MFKMTLIWRIIGFLFSKNITFARIKEISQYTHSFPHSLSEYALFI
jgi:hypothetical protein